MKKLIIASVAIVMAACAQAVTVQWMSGALYTAASKTGGWSATGVMAASAVVTMNVYLVDSTTYATVSAMDQKGIYDWSNEAGRTATYTAQNKNGESIIGAATAKDTAFAASTPFYSIITATYKDATYGDMYMASSASGSSPASGSKSVQNIFGGTTGVKNWQPAGVPEPTSGLLVMLGVGLMALRRRRA